jgi:tetratricopeptide (TPR) repeat protein
MAKAKRKAAAKSAAPARPKAKSAKKPPKAKPAPPKAKAKAAAAPAKAAPAKASPVRDERKALAKPPAKPSAPAKAATAPSAPVAKAPAAAKVPVGKAPVAKVPVAKAPVAVAKAAAPAGKVKAPSGKPPVATKSKARPTIVSPPVPKAPPEELLLEKAQRAIQMGENDVAERLLEQMIGEFPDDPRGRIYLGNFRRRRGDEKGALEEYSKILRRNPQEPLALWYKAELHLAQKPDPDFAQAVATYKKIVQAHGRKKDERSRKFVEEAKKQLRFCEARKLSLQSRRYLTSEETRTLKKGRDLLEKALELYPEDARNHMNLGVAHLLLGDAERAVSLCEEAIKLNGRYARAHLMLGRAFRKLHRLRHARDAFLKCIDLDRSGRDAQDAWNDRREVERDIAKVRLTLFHALAGRPGPDGQRVRLTLGQMKHMITMLEGDEIKEADLTENAQKTYTLTAYSQRHLYRIYPGPESLVIEPDAQPV